MDGAWIKDPIFKLVIEAELLAEVRLDAVRRGLSISRRIGEAIRRDLDRKGR